jgi:DNA mismatch endonuclease, patch repair protein
MDNKSMNQRRINMSKIRSTETLPERRLRSALHRKGFRFRKNVNYLPGKPDIVLRKYKTVIFMNGCFWHYHRDCTRGKIPKTNRKYWRRKLLANIERDQKIHKLLRSNGWKVILVWECELSQELENTIKYVNSELLSQKRRLRMG